MGLAGGFLAVVQDGRTADHMTTMTDACADYLPPPTTCETLATMVARFGGSLRLGPKVEGFKNEGAPEMSAEVRAFLSKQETALPPTVESQVGALHTLYRERAAWWNGEST